MVLAGVRIKMNAEEKKKRENAINGVKCFKNKPFGDLNLTKIAYLFTIHNTYKLLPKGIRLMCDQCDWTTDNKRYLKQHHLSAHEGKRLPHINPLTHGRFFRPIFQSGLRNGKTNLYFFSSYGHA